MSKPTPGRLSRLAFAQENRCAYCQETFGSFDDEANPTLDHVIPQARGGRNIESNFVAACARCNHAKGAMDAATFCAIIDAGNLRPRRNMAKARLKRHDERRQATALQAELEAAFRQPAKIGKPGAPFSKNKPLRRLYYHADLPGNIERHEALNPDVRDGRPL